MTLASLFEDMRRPLREIIELPLRPKDTITLEAVTFHGLGSHGDPSRTGEALFSGDALDRSTIEDFVPTPEIRTFAQQVFNKVLAGEGQGWWLQAEYGSGKSHLLAFLTIMCASLDETPWEILARTEQEREKRGPRESLANEEFRGLKDRLVFPIVRSLAGAGGDIVGSSAQGNYLINYILDTAKRVYEGFTGKPFRVLPSELLAQHFLGTRTPGQETDLGAWLGKQGSRGNTAVGSFADFEALCEESLQDAGELLWEWIGDGGPLNPGSIPTDPKSVLKGMVDQILEAGFDGVLVVLDEVSEFLNKSSNLSRDEDVLICLSEILPRTYDLPVWTICAAQHKIEQEAGMKRIIAENRLNEQNLLIDPLSFHDIVLKRTRVVTDSVGVGEHLKYYRGRFGWVDGLAQERLARVFQGRYFGTENLPDDELAERYYEYLFPLHPAVLDQTKAVASRLTTTRAGIVVVYDAIDQQVRATDSARAKEMVTPDRLYDQFESLTDGENTFQSKFPREYEALDKARQALQRAEALPASKYKDQPLRALKTLFMAFLEDPDSPRHMTPREVCDAIMMTRKADSTAQENEDGVREMLRRMRRPTIPQVCGTDDDSEFWFDASVGVVAPPEIFGQVRGEIRQALHQQGGDPFKVDELSRAWLRWMLMGAAEAQKTAGNRGSQHDDAVAWLQGCASHVRTDFADIIAKRFTSKETVLWHGRDVQGRVELVENWASDVPPDIRTGDSRGDDQDIDFVVRIARRPNGDTARALARDSGIDPRYVFWTPDTLSETEAEALVDWAALLKLVDRYRTKQGEEAELVLSWVRDRASTYAQAMVSVLMSAYDRGAITSHNVGTHSFEYSGVGSLASVIAKVVGAVLDTVYESKCLELPVSGMARAGQGFGSEEAIGVINGMVRHGRIASGPRDKATSASERYAAPLGLAAENSAVVDLSQCRFASDLLEFIQEKLASSSSVDMQTIYLNFMGIDPQQRKGVGLARRLVQVYLLALVQGGEIKVSVSNGGSPLDGIDEIDHGNIGSITFNADILGKLKSVRLVEIPAEWDCLRGIAEVMLGEPLSAKADEKEIQRDWQRVESRITELGQGAQRIYEELRAFLAAVGAQSEHAATASAFAGVLGTELTGGMDGRMHNLAWAIEDRLGVELHADGKVRAPSGKELKGFGARWETYLSCREFVEDWKDKVLLAKRCANLELPSEGHQAVEVRKAVERLGEVLGDVDRLIVDAAWRASQFAPACEEAQKAYWGLYETAHVELQRTYESARTRLEAARAGSELAALADLDGVPSLGPAAAPRVDSQIAGALASLQPCGVTTQGELRDLLRSSLECRCGLTVAEADAHRREVEAIAESVSMSPRAALEAKADVLLSEAVGERLKAASGDERIGRIVRSRKVEPLAQYLVQELTADRTSGTKGGLVEALKAALGDVVSVEVRWSELCPAASAIERGQVEAVVGAVRDALMRALDEAEADGAQAILHIKGSGE